MSSSALSDLVLNRERSNDRSKGRSSKNNHSSRQESTFIEGVGLNELSCLLSLLEIRLGLSTTGAGFGYGFALVKQVFLEAGISKKINFFCEIFSK